MQWTAIRLHSGHSPVEFAESFQEVLHQLKSVVDTIYPTTELLQFCKAIPFNRDCRWLIQTLDMDLQGPNFMTAVYASFLKSQAGVNAQVRASIDTTNAYYVTYGMLR